MGNRRVTRLQATSPPEARGLARDDVRLLVSTTRGHEHARFRDLPRFLSPGTLLVVNRSATLPASLRVRGRPGRFLLNLSTRYGGELWLAEPRWSASEPGPIALKPGEMLEAGGLSVRMVSPFPGLPRLWFVRLEGDVDAAMATHGSPIRYGYLEPPYPPLEAYQTVFAAVPGSAEMPSAARPFTERTLEGLWLRGVRLASIVLHAGVSSLDLAVAQVDAAASSAELPTVGEATDVVSGLQPAWGDSLRLTSSSTAVRAVPDASTPVDRVVHRVEQASHPEPVQVSRDTWEVVDTTRADHIGCLADQILYPEPFHVPADTADAVNTARAVGRPVIAVGTTVVRALESARTGDYVRAASGFTRRFVHAANPIHAVDGLLTGLHDPMATHLAMLHALAGPDLIRSSYEEAVRAGYLWHEFGDSHLLLP